MKFLFLKERFILKKMINKYFFLALLALGCQKDLLDSEKEDFKSRCMHSETLNKVSDNEEIREFFCQCILNNISEMDLEYEDFLNQEIDKDDIILNGCIDKKSSDNKDPK